LSAVGQIFKVLKRLGFVIFVNRTERFVRGGCHKRRAQDLAAGLAVIRGQERAKEAAEGRLAAQAKGKARLKSLKPWWEERTGG
jgi:hypothetical protein